MHNDLIPYVMGTVVTFIVLVDFSRKLMLTLNCLALWTTITIFIILRYIWGEAVNFVGLHIYVGGYLRTNIVLRYIWVNTL